MYISVVFNIYYFGTSISEAPKGEVEGEASLRALETARTNAEQEIDKLKSETQGLVKGMVEGGEEKCTKILRKLSAWRRIGKTQGWKEFLECAIKNI